MRAKTKINILVGTLLLVIAALLCCAVGVFKTQTASAATNVITVQTLTGTEHTKHNYYGYQNDWEEDLPFNTGIKFYGAESSASGTNTNTNEVKLDVNSVYIDFTNATRLYIPDDCYSYIDRDYQFCILDSANRTVFTASIYGDFYLDSNWEYCDYTKRVSVNGDEYEETYRVEELLHFTPQDFGKRLVNLPDGRYTVKITRNYLWTYNYTDCFYFYAYDYYESTSSMTGTLVVSNSAPTVSITNPSGNRVTSGSSINQRVTFTAGGEFFSKLYYRTPSSTSYVSTANKTYQIGTANGWYYVYAEDIFGKQSETLSVYYDGTPPVGTLYANGTTVANGSYINSTFYFIANDTGIGIDSVYYKSPISGIYAPYSSGSIIPVNAGDGWYYFYATDRVGNCSETMSVFLETQPPVVDIYKNGTKTYSKVFSTLVDSRFGGGVTGYNSSSDIWVHKLKCRCGSSMKRNKWRVNLNGEIIYGYKCYNQLNNGSKQLRVKSGVAADGYCDLSEICDWKLELTARKVFSSLWGDYKSAVIEAYHIYNNCYVEDSTQNIEQREDLLTQLQRAKLKLDNLTNMRIEGEISKAEYQEHRQKMSLQIAEIEKNLMQFENKTNDVKSGKMSFEQLSELLFKKIDFTQPKMDRQFLEQTIYRIVPNTQDDFSWYLNLLPRDNFNLDNFHEICTVTINFEEARQYRKSRKGMLRKNQWRDVTAHIYV